MIKSSRVTALFWVFSFVLFSALTLVIFSHRLDNLFTQYTMPDIDTDGGLWYQWYSIFTKSHGLLFELNSLMGYPFSFDMDYLPFSNLVYSMQIFVLEHITGYSWQNLIFVTNISSLITYPLSAIGGSALAYYLTKNKKASLIAGLIFGFSFYHIFMGRGEMSINHTELIPIYFLSLFYFLDKRNSFSLVLSSLTFSILFKADPYYAFFSGIFSIIVFLIYKDESFAKKLKSFLTYYPLLFLVLILMNVSYIQSNLYLFNTQQAVTSGRHSIAKNELTDLSHYFFPVQLLNKGYQEAKRVTLTQNFVFDNLRPVSFAINIVPIVIALLGLIYFRRQRLFILLLACFLLGVVLSSYVPVLYWLNELYFRYFGVFRGVGRIILLSYLFLGLLIGVSISQFEKSKRFKKIDKRIYGAVLILIPVLYIISAVNGVDQTWTRRTDLSKTAKLYESIQKNPYVKVLATYPMTQRGEPVGCPETFRIVAQIIHNKAYACGASPFSKPSQDYYRSIKDIDNSNTIGILTKHNVDTILIYNKLENNSKKINEMLSRDERLKFIGRWKLPGDFGYQSVNDVSRDISAYQIKEVVENNKKPHPLFFFLGDKTEVSFKKITPYKYKIDIKNLKDTSTLVFDSSFSRKWKIFEGDLSRESAIGFINKKPIFDNSQKRFNESANSWEIDEDSISKNFSNGNFTKNSDGSINTTITLFYQPQTQQQLGRLITYISFFVLIIFLIFKYFNEKHKR